MAQMIGAYVRKAKLKSMLLASVAGLALGAPAHGQDTNTAEQLAEVDEILVLGFRQATRSAIAEKREADGVADFLSQDDLGRVPDLNIVESLQRAPGVLSVFDEDEGRYIAVRGLSSIFTNVAIDGSSLAVNDKTQRRPNLESVPPSAVRQLEVYKTITPDIDGNSIGGFVNLRTRSAFDTDGTYIVGQALLGQHTAQYIPTARNKLSYNLHGTVASQFGDQDQFGFVTYGTYFLKTRDQTKNNRTNRIINDQPAVSTVIPLDYANTIDRYSFGGKLEYKPTNDTYFYFQGSRYYYDYDDEFRWNVRLDGNGGSLVQNGRSGSYGQARARGQTVAFPLDLDLEYMQVHGEGPLWGGIWDAQASFSKAGWIEPNDLVNWDAGTSADFAYSYDFDTVDPRGLPATSIANPAAVADLTRYEFQNYETDFVDLDEEVKEVTANYTWNADQRDRGLGFKSGMRWRELDRNYNRDRFRFNYTGDSDISYDVFADATTYQPRRTPGITQFFGRLDQWLEFFAANRSDFVDDGSSEIRSIQSDYGVLETVTAGYGMVTYAGEQFRFVGGLRYEYTDVNARSSFDNNGTREIQVRGTEYDDFLPSAQFRYDVNETMRVTLGYSRTIGRPNHPDLALAVSRDLNDDGTIDITRGNPDLKPRRSNNFDVAFDWFFQEGGLVSVAVFHKDITDEIFRVSTEEIIDGQVFNISQPVNTTGARVTGVELSLIDDQFEFLPAPFDGFGMNANLTWLDGNLDIVDGDGAFVRASGVLVEAPELIANLSLLYALGPFDARFAISYTDEYYTRLRANPVQDRTEGKYIQYDYNMRYRVNDNFALSFEARNLSNRARVSTEGGLVRGVNDFGQSFWLGVNYTY